VAESRGEAGGRHPALHEEVVGVSQALQRHGGEAWQDGLEVERGQGE